eukprot:scaffold1307_cov200-Pinguiococcus_pyrenoidosus.AAC.71
MIAATCLRAGHRRTFFRRKGRIVPCPPAPMRLRRTRVAGIAPIPFAIRKIPASPFVAPPFSVLAAFSPTDLEGQEKAGKVSRRRLHLHSEASGSSNEPSLNAAHHPVIDCASAPVCDNRPCYDWSMSTPLAILWNLSRPSGTKNHAAQVPLRPPRLPKPTRSKKMALRTCHFDPAVGDSVLC